MRIDRLHVHNFKGFQDREFAFHPQVNLIVGENGTGKTSLLDALAVALGGWFLGLKGCDTRHIRQQEVRLLAVAPDTGPVSWEYQYECAIRASGEVQGETLTWMRSLNTTGGRTRFVEARNIKQLGVVADTAVRQGTPVTLPLISYYGTGRLWDIPRGNNAENSERPRSKKDLRSRFDGYRHSLDPRLSVSELTRWIERQEWISFQQRGDDPPAYAAVKAAILGCLEGAESIRFDVSRGEVVVAIVGQGLQPFSNLSDGQRTMLALVADIAQKAATLNPWLGVTAICETPGVVLIDELDLHLHPIWQQRVIEDLRRTFPKIQFVATTHSPFLIQSLRSGEELLMLDGAGATQVANRSIGDIAAVIMGVKPTSTSQRYDEMKDSAVAYLEKLEEAAKAPADKRADFEAELSRGVAVFADNPAYQAFLEMRRAAKLGK